MVKNTRRDKIWVEILQIHRDLPEQVIQPEYDNVAGFTKADIQKRVDADVSKRTINDVVQTAVEHDLIEMVKSPAHASLQEHPITGERTQANVYRLTDDLVSPERTQGEDTQNADEAVSNTGEPDESDSEEHTQPAEAQLEASQDDDESRVNETKANDAEPLPNETVIDPAITTHDIDQLPFDEGYGSRRTFRDLPNVSKKRTFNLMADGFKRFNDLYVASVDELSQVDGIGTKTARKIKIYIADMIRKKRDVSFEQIASEPESHIAEEYNLDEKAAKAFHDHALAKTKHTQNPAEA